MTSKGGSGPPYAQTASLQVLSDAASRFDSPAAPPGSLGTAAAYVPARGLEEKHFLLGHTAAVAVWLCVSQDIPQSHTWQFRSKDLGVPPFPPNSHSTLEWEESPGGGEQIRPQSQSVCMWGEVGGGLLGSVDFRPQSGQVLWIQFGGLERGVSRL